MNPVNKVSAFARLPVPSHSPDLHGRLAKHRNEYEGKIVVLDDDPTGTQTVHDLTVLTKWGQDIIERMFLAPERTFYISTNSRSLLEEESLRLTEDLVTILAETSKRLGKKFTLISRSDSTLRGHFPAEIEISMKATSRLLGTTFQGIVVAPAFFEGKRYTFDDVHWVEKDGMLFPAAQTEFAQDPAFGYKNSNLRKWVLEKYKGGIEESKIISIDLSLIRRGGCQGVSQLLVNSEPGSVFIINATDYTDLEVVSCALFAAQNKGINFIYRTAASFVRVFSGIGFRPYLTAQDLQTKAFHQGLAKGGLIIVGSHTETSTAQLRHLLGRPRSKGIEMNVTALLTEKGYCAEIERVSELGWDMLQRGVNVAVFTSRTVITGGAGESYLKIGQLIQRALVEIVRRLANNCSFLVAKGGITSSTLATDALNVTQARVLGQVLPGVSVWRLGQKALVPNLPYIVFPGNVGEEADLLKVVEMASVN